MDWVLFAVFLFACGASMTSGAIFPPGPWYEALKKPGWTPPDWVFPVTWIVLYLCIAFAASRVAVLPGTGIAMALLAAQFGFNVLWTPVFFGLRRMGAAFVVVMLLWVSVAGTMLAFFQHDVLAGLLFVPYIIWVTIAAALNFTVWRMNPDVEPLGAS
ncbi:MAG: TspO/MBR family protein [Pseudomonadota bacterium]